MELMVEDALLRRRPGKGSSNWPGTLSDVSSRNGGSDSAERSATQVECDGWERGREAMGPTQDARDEISG